MHRHVNFTSRVTSDAFAQRRAELAAMLAPAHRNLGPEALGPRIIDLLLRNAAHASNLMCAPCLAACQYPWVTLEGAGCCRC